ncbi:MAG: aldehyde dehydrogenase family protein [Vicinamibacteria bacterium]|jgi:1-pyrroline-5-carboxylate dehydrogenase|nr:aldehyde dehydrogenase family protein [Vicinamibacteria bacterium]
MAFRNEFSYHRAMKSGREAAVDRAFEKAVAQLVARAGRRYPLVIDGEETFSAAGEFESLNPADTRMAVGRFQKGTAEHVDRAVAAARAAYDRWRRVPYLKRAAIIERAARILQKRRYELWAAMTLEAGKNRFEASIDADEATDFCRYYAMQLVRHKGYRIPMGSPFPDERCASELKPFGVWGVIAPFNFPVAITMGMTVGAILAGNTVVLKPSSDCPLCGWLVFDALREAGLPQGVLNFVTGGGGAVGAPLIRHHGVDGFVFTGSFETGMANFRAAIAERPRPYIAEMGGKNAIIISARANLKDAAEGVLRSAFGYSGQKCSACSRVLVDRRVHDEFVRLLVEKTRSLSVGDPREKATFVGPVINEEARRRFREAAELAARECSVAAGGHLLDSGAQAYGYFVQPTIVDNVPRDHRLAREELFLPFVAVVTVDDFDDALAVANSSEYGLTAGIFTRDRREIRRFFDDMQAGVLYANRTRGGSTGAVVGGQTFVGWKSSGTTGRGAGGPYYVAQFMREQGQTDCQVTAKH